MLEQTDRLSFGRELPDLITAIITTMTTKEK